jgi:hypothetical protein
MKEGDTQHGDLTSLQFLPSGRETQQGDCLMRVYSEGVRVDFQWTSERYIPEDRNLKKFSIQIH